MRRGPLRAAAAAAAIACAAVLAACGGGDEEKAARDTTTSPQVKYGYLGPGLHGSISLADCSDWQRGPENARAATIQQLRTFYGGEVGSGNKGRPRTKGPVLGDDQAYNLLKRYCAQSFASQFKLYKLYGRAAGFAGGR